MSYCIVEFPPVRGKKEIGVVHRKWMQGEDCYWPDFWKNNKKLVEALHLGTPPGPDWTLYKVRVVGNRFYDSYLEARGRLPRAEDGSELSSDDHGKQRRRNKTKATDTDDSCSEDETQQKPKRAKDKQSPVILPPPPQQPSTSSYQYPPHGGISYGHTNSLPTLVNVKYENLQDVEPEPVQYVIPTGQTSIPRDSNPPFAFNENFGPTTGIHHMPYPNGPMSSYGNSSNASATIGTTTPTTPYMYPPPSDISGDLFMPTSNLRGISTSISALHDGQVILTAKVDMLHDMVRTLLQGHVLPVVNADTTKINLPVTSLEGFEQLDQLVKADQGAKNALIGMLSVKGGNTPNQITYRIMAALMTDELMLTFTMAGQKSGKRGFRDSELMRCVCDAVRKNKLGSVANDDKIESATEYWIKKTKTRMEAASKKRKNEAELDSGETADN